MCPRVQFRSGLIVPLITVIAAAACDAQVSESMTTAAPDVPTARPVLVSTAQFRALKWGDYLDERPFRLTGVVTLVDKHRDLIVLQDEAGALAVNYDLQKSSVEVGQGIVLEGRDWYPYFVNFPDYPFRPSGRQVRPSFEAPSNWGEYHLVRMRGYIHPDVTGDYTFWIASDNSSELWLSTNKSPSNAKRIAFISRYDWTLRHEWTKFPSQRSETIRLQAGQEYYIEALQEQKTAADNLSVAWQGPGLKQCVIDESYITPWRQGGLETIAGKTNGVLYEYWTNYSAGDVAILSGVKPFESALTASEVKITVLGNADLPKPRDISLSQRLLPKDNFRWLQVEGTVKFVSTDADAQFLELSDGESQVQVMARNLSPDTLNRLRNSVVRVEGVCECGRDKNGALMPRVIWTGSGKFIVQVPASSRSAKAVPEPVMPSPVSPGVAMEGYYGTRAVITFNGRVLGKDYLFAQADCTAILVSLSLLKGHQVENHLEVGQAVDLSGSLHSGKNFAVLDPLVVTELGWSWLPAPVSQSLQLPFSSSADGRWTEVEGVVRSVNTNGTLSMRRKGGPVYLWIAKTARDQLCNYVDAKIRVRGVLSLTTLDSPLVLIPSPSFVDVEEAKPEDPFQMPAVAVADLFSMDEQESLVHRVKVRGEIVYHDKQTTIVQDSSGGIRVQVVENSPISLQQRVEVIGFPTEDGSGKRLADSSLRPSHENKLVKPTPLDLTDSQLLHQNGMLVEVAATLLGQKQIENCQVLEVQEQQRIFTATLSTNAGTLPRIEWGSRIKIVGVRDDGLSLTPFEKLASGVSAGSLNVLLRSPTDVAVLSGPPWWTVKRTVVPVATLLVTVGVTLLWVYFLRRRLDRQQAAQLAISRQILRSQESERQRIAINLHDSLGQNLLVIKNQACLAMEPGEEESSRQARLSRISEMTSQAIEEVRQITHDLRPYQLDRLGLTQAVRAVVNQVADNSSIVIASCLDNIDGIFDKESEIHVYRLVQEALNNILKHSAASEAAVVVKNRPGLVSLSIRDNGRGFDAGASSRSRDSGFGISGITERVGILGGVCAIDSKPSHGTNVTVEIPKLPKDDVRNHNSHR